MRIGRYDSKRRRQVAGYNPAFIAYHSENAAQLLTYLPPPPSKSLSSPPPRQLSDVALFLSLRFLPFVRACAAENDVSVEQYTYLEFFSDVNSTYTHPLSLVGQ